MRTLIILAVVSLLLVASVGHSADVVLLQQTTVDTNGLTLSGGSFSLNINGRSFQQQNAVSTFNGYQYTTYYDANRNVCVGRRQLPAGAWEIIRLTDYVMSGNDSHDVTVLGICAADGTIHLAFDHHGSTLHYRVSAQGVVSNPGSVVWDASLFGPVTSVLGSVGSISGVTYPRFFNAPNGNLMLYYRFGGSGSGDGMIQEYNGTTHDWTTGLGKFIARTGTYNGVLSTNSTSRNPYINGIFYAGSRLHASWGWRESAGSSQNNHDLCYAYSDDDGRTWRNNAGTIIGTTGTSFVTLDSAGLVVAPIPQNESLGNQFTQYAYPDGSVHVMLKHNGVYQHYWRNAAGVWNSASLTFSGSRPKIVGDSDGTLFLVYTTGGTVRIGKGVPNAGMTAWTWSLVYTQLGTPAGGEGLVDTSRWETERALSVYDQEEPPVEGDPSPLHLWDYQVSSQAIFPDPTDNATGVPADTNLTWTDGLNAVSHDVYLGTNEAAVASATPISPEFKGQQAGNVYQPALLNAGTTYFWRIDEVQADLSVVVGQVWQFTSQPFVPNTVAHAGGDQSVPDAGVDGIELITLDGSGTIPGDGLSITSYIWNRGSRQIATGVSTNVTLPLGTHLITLLVTDSSAVTTSDTATITVTPTASLSTNLMAAWDDFVGTNAFVPTQLDADTTVSVSATTAHNPWGHWFNLGQSASADGTFGNLSAAVASADTIIASDTNAVTLNRSDGTLEFTLTNNSAVDRTMNGFYFDCVSKFGNSAKNWELTASGAISGASSSGPATQVNDGFGAASPAERDHAVDLSALTDNVWEAGTAIVLSLAFTGSANDGSGGGNELLVDNIAITHQSVGDAYPDNDGNGLQDWWEVYYLGSTGQVASLDSDLDGLSNGDELITGTDPDDINSALVVHEFEEEAGGGYTVKWDSYSDRTYDVLQAPVLGSNVWSSTSGPLPGTGGEMSFTDTASPSNTFYKIQVTQP